MFNLAAWRIHLLHRWLLVSLHVYCSPLYSKVCVSIVYIHTDQDLQTPSLVSEYDTAVVYAYPFVHVPKYSAVEYIYHCCRLDSKSASLVDKLGVYML